MHERISVNQICFLGEPVETLASHLRELEPRRVSLVSAPLLGGELPAVRAALGDYQIETINYPFMHGCSLDAGEQSWSEARVELSRLIKIAAELGANSVYLLTGGRGSLNWEAAAAAFSAAIEPCAAQARAANIALMVENAPSLYADLHVAHTLRDAVTLAEMADIGVCIDLPTCWTEADLRASIERAMPRCGLIQVSDYVLGDRSYPSRAVPGDGAMPLERLFEWALDAGYKGAFDLELLGPRIDKEGRVLAVRRAAERVGAILQSLGV